MPLMLLLAREKTNGRDPRADGSFIARLKRLLLTRTQGDGAGDCGCSGSDGAGGSEGGGAAKGGSPGWRRNSRIGARDNPTLGHTSKCAVKDRMTLLEATLPRLKDEVESSAFRQR